MSRLTFLVLVLLNLGGMAFADEDVSKIHVIVALCDNESQGIQPVNPRIGDGDIPSANLYWGCSDGLRSWFESSSAWETVSIESATGDEVPEAKILETAVFRHRKTGAMLKAEAWRGREIEAATARYIEMLCDDSPTGADLVAYIGHNGLMDFEVPNAEALRANASAPDTAILCCVSGPVFTPILELVGARPILLTEQLMYPGSFLLEAALEGWLQGESRPQIRERAAAAYGKNQGISVRAGRGIFAALE